MQHLSEKPYIAGTEITEDFAGWVVNTLHAGKRVHRRLEGGGLIAIDRALPYLIVYRFPDEEPDRGMRSLVLSEASCLIMPASEPYHEKIRMLAEGLSEALSSTFGAFLLFEVWLAGDAHETFRIRCSALDGRSTTDTLREELHSLHEIHPGVDVEEQCSDHRYPPYARALVSSEESAKRGVLTLGLEVPGIFRSRESGAVFPVFFRLLKRYVSRALRETVSDFLRVQTTCELSSADMLGRKSVSRSVWHVDRKLAEIEASFPFLLLVSPVNSSEAWQEFRAGGFETPPQFHYRLLPVDPEELKRRLYHLRMDAIEDPTLSQLLRDKREELDIQITMLAERNTPKFLYSGIRLYKGVDADLVKEAESILSAVPPPAAGKATDQQVDAETFKRAAEQEFEHLRQQYRAFSSRIEIRDDVSGLMVSRGNLLIDSRLRIHPDRLEALVQHEVGTHVLTYCNGLAQPLRQLSHGLDDYDELQEGLAVLAEYLVGRLNRARMRLLAARVIAAHGVQEGATFIDLFRLLRSDLGFQPRTSFDVVTRVFSCGGFIKDVIYFRGLLHLMDYLRKGHPIEPLYIGKIALKHVPVMNELRARNVLREIPLMPRYLTTDMGRERLQRLREGLPVTALID